VTHPLLKDVILPKISRRRIPRQKFSMSVYISGGLRVGSDGSPSQMITSVSEKQMSPSCLRFKGMHTNVAMHKPTVGGPANGSADSNKAVLFRPC
jgi:hypothetical protein